MSTLADSLWGAGGGRSGNWWEKKLCCQLLQCTFDSNQLAISSMCVHPAHGTNVSSLLLPSTSASRSLFCKDYSVGWFDFLFSCLLLFPPVITSHWFSGMMSYSAPFHLLMYLMKIQFLKHFLFLNLSLSLAASLMDDMILAKTIMSSLVLAFSSRQWETLTVPLTNVFWKITEDPCNVWI